MTACSQDRNALATYLDGELSPEKERSLQEHLRTARSALQRSPRR